MHCLRMLLYETGFGKHYFLLVFLPNDYFGTAILNLNELLYELWHVSLTVS